MKKIVFVSIDEPERWSQWHSGNTEKVYYSDFFNKKENADAFIEQVKTDYPDNNLIDNKYNHKYFIDYIILDFDETDTKGFTTLKTMMHAYNHYNNRK